MSRDGDGRERHATGCTTAKNQAPVGIPWPPPKAGAGRSSPEAARVR